VVNKFGSSVKHIGVFVGGFVGALCVAGGASVYASSLSVNQVLESERIESDEANEERERLAALSSAAREIPQGLMSSKGEILLDDCGKPIQVSQAEIGRIPQLAQPERLQGAAVDQELKDIEDVTDRLRGPLLERLEKGQEVSVEEFEAANAEIAATLDRMHGQNDELVAQNRAAQPMYGEDILEALPHLSECEE